MRSCVIWLVVATSLTGVAHAQTPASVSSRGYAEAVAQSAFGNVTSQSYGGELGVTIISGLHVFVDAGQVSDTRASDLDASARLVANSVNGQFQARQPIRFGLAGVRYSLSSSGPVEPYLLGGAGIARVKKDVTFTVGGADITNNFQQFSGVLGTDLSGSEIKPMLTLGGGVAWPVWQHMVIDFQYRYGRVFASDQGIDVHRAGVGIGVRF